MNDPNLALMTYNAKKFHREIVEIAEPISNVDRYAKALRQIRGKLYEIVHRYLADAVQQTVEYDIPSLKRDLYRNFRNDMFFTVGNNGVLYLHANECAGTPAEFEEGVRKARQVFHVHKSKKTMEERAAFWRDFVFGPARLGMAVEIYKGKNKKPSKKEAGDAKDKTREARRMYYAMIRARKEAWGELTPYWYWLEHGNEQHAALAFPHFPATRFYTNAIRDCRALYNQTRKSVLGQEYDILSKIVEEFSRHPEDYTPGQILGTIYDEEDKRHRVYVTYVTHQIGVSPRPGH